MSRIKNLREEALAMHKEYQGKIEVRVKAPVRDNDDLTLAYSPGVAEPCMEIHKDPAMLDVYTNHSNFVCVVSNGTAVVTLAGLMNALKIVGKKLDEITVVTSGAGAAGIAIIKLLMAVGLKNVIMCDSKGAIWEGRPEGMNPYKDEIAKHTNPNKVKGGLAEAIKGADVFIGVSAPNSLNEDMIRSMAKDPIVFAQANPIPEIWPLQRAFDGGAKVVATGRSDCPNQINNVLAFPGIFRGAIDVRATDINDAMKIAAAKALADLVKPEELSASMIIPSTLNPDVAPLVAAATAKAAMESGIARVHMNPDDVAENLRKRLAKRQG